MELPKDPAILLSYVNLKLRDFYPSLDEMCKDLGISKDEVTERLKGAGYSYNEKRNRFV